MRRFELARPPFVVCLTNTVAANFTANALLAIGAKPAMVEEPSEAAELAAAADAVLVNVGTLTPAQAEVMRAAVRACKAWVLDPVACQALSYRRAFVEELLAQGPTAIRGNQAEIECLTKLIAAREGTRRTGPCCASDLAAREGTRRTGPRCASDLAAREGTRRTGPRCASDLAAREGTRRTGSRCAPELAAREGTRRTGSRCASASDARRPIPSLATGEVDVIRSGAEIVERIPGGVPLLQSVTATGCAQGAIVAAFLGAGQAPLEALRSASRLMKNAGERAWKRAKTPGSFQIALLDSLWELTHA